MRQLVSVWVTFAVGLLIVVSASAGKSTIGARAVSPYKWTRADLGAISQPAAVGNRFVLYAQHAGSLEVVALRAQDGSTAWVAAASPSFVTAGVAAALAVRAGAVFFFQPVAGQLGVARLVGRDVASGKIRWRSSPATFASWPEICPDQPTAICLTGLLPTGGSGELRFDAASGRQLRPVKMGATNTGSRELVAGLFDVGVRNPDLLLATSRGRVAWLRRLSEIFTLPRASSDGGWNLDRLRRPGLFVGSVGTTPKIVGGKGIVNVARTMTAGFAIDNGRVVWRSAGFYVCTLLPCPGGNEAGYTAPDTISAAGPSVGLREVMKGTVSFRVGGGSPQISADASVTIQGFSLATGKTNWAFDAGHNTGLISGQLVPARIDPNTIVVRNRARRLVALDLRNGSSHPVSSATTGWCRKTITYRLSNGGYYQGKNGQYIGQAGLYPCTPDSKRIATPVRVPALVGQIGAANGGTVAWADTHAVHAATLR